MRPCATLICGATNSVLLRKCGICMFPKGMQPTDICFFLETCNGECDVFGGDFYEQEKESWSKSFDAV